MKDEEYLKLNVGDEVICRISTNNTHANFVYKLKGFYGINVRIILPYNEVEYSIPTQQFIHCFDIFKNNMTKQDRVNHPSHYTWLKDLCGIEVIDITRHMNFNLGNTIKYILRAGHKSEKGLSDKQKHIEDLKKALFYIKDEIKRLEEKEKKDGK